MSQHPLSPAPRRPDGHVRIQTSIWLPPELRRALRVAAAERGIPFGDLMRSVLREWLEREGR